MVQQAHKLDADHQKPVRASSFASKEVSIVQPSGAPGQIGGIAINEIVAPKRVNTPVRDEHQTTIHLQSDQSIIESTIGERGVVTPEDPRSTTDHSRERANTPTETPLKPASARQRVTTNVESIVATQKSINAPEDAPSAKGRTTSNTTRAKKIAKEEALTSPRSTSRASRVNINPSKMKWEPHQQPEDAGGESNYDQFNTDNPDIDQSSPSIAAGAEKTWASTQAKLGRTRNNASLMKRNVQQARLRPNTNRPSNTPTSMSQVNQPNRGKNTGPVQPEAEIREVISQLNRAHGEDLRTLAKQLKRLLDEQERRHKTDLDGMRREFDYFRDN